MYLRYVIQLASFGGALLIAIIAANVIVDPFAYNQTAFIDYTRRQVAYPVSPDVYKAARFRNNVADTVFLGDSTVDQFDWEILGAVGQPAVENLAIPGQSLFDSIDTLRFAAKSPAVRRVFIGIPFRHYDDAQVKRVFLQNSLVARNFFTLNSSATTTRAMFYSLVHLAMGSLPTEELPVTRDEFWDYQLAVIKTQLDARGPSVRLRAALLEAVCDLRAAGVDVVAFVPPVYQELRQMILDRYADDYSAYKNWLPALGVVLDYDIDSDITRDRARFKDHVHLTPGAARMVLADAMGATPQFARRIDGLPGCP